MENKVQFVEEKVLKSFEKLKSGKSEDKQLLEWLERAFDDIKQNPFCGIQVSRRLIPKGYLKKYKIHNLSKYNLLNAWRLLYSIENNQIFILFIILEWLNYKEYERRFKY